MFDTLAIASEHMGQCFDYKAVVHMRDLDWPTGEEVGLAVNKDLLPMIHFPVPHVHNF